mmetsp:Transcript_73285/g.110571  ORF Transcript_73285/g.110571 Transcript_73285/m.110571 type:complete len:97 (-) Transcript_73285:571-861(-)
MVADVVILLLRFHDRDGEGSLLPNRRKEFFAWVKMVLRTWQNITKLQKSIVANEVYDAGSTVQCTTLSSHSTSPSSKGSAVVDLTHPSGQSLTKHP